MDDIVHFYHELALRASISAAIEANVTQIVPYSGQEFQTQFVWDTWIAKAGFYVSNIGNGVVFVCLVLLRWGWWMLAEERTMSPIDITLAFWREAQAGLITAGRERAVLAESGEGAGEDEGEGSAEGA